MDDDGGQGEGQVGYIDNLMLPALPCNKYPVFQEKIVPSFMRCRHPSPCLPYLLPCLPKGRSIVKLARTEARGIETRPIVHGAVL
jgi:hypothetical protein